MKNKTLCVFSLLVLVMTILPLVCSETLWTFDNFRNRYKVYGSASCAVFGTAACPNEMGWEGNKISFTFPLKNIASLPGVLQFNIGSNYYINDKIIDILVNGRKVASGYIVDGWGTHSVTFTRAAVVNGPNAISIVMHAPVGYGNPSAGFVLDYVSLESVDESILPNCFKNADCGVNGLIDSKFCTGLKPSQNYITYVCKNPGASGYCTDTTSVVLKPACVAKACTAFGANYCDGTSLYHSRTCYTVGCTDGLCTQTPRTDIQKIKTCLITCKVNVCSA